MKVEQDLTATRKICGRSRGAGFPKNLLLCLAQSSSPPIHKKSGLISNVTVTAQLLPVPTHISGNSLDLVQTDVPGVVGVCVPPPINC